MLNRKDFDELSSSLGSLCFADNIITALAYFRKNKTLRPEDKSLLDEAESYFESVLDGFEWSTNPSISQQSVQSASAFTNAVQALAIRVEMGDPTAFRAHIKQLLQTVRDVGGDANDSNVQSLQDFFTSFGYAQLDKTKDIASPINSRDALLWMTGVL